jgi:uncharacterized protein YidB (DUF937 family)
MGFLSGLAGNLFSSLIPGVENGHPALAPLLQLIRSQPGGIAGLAQQFEQGGMGDIAQSWVGSGANQAVSANQIQSVLGGSLVPRLAEAMGVSPDVASGHLAQLLPGIVDHLTPGGSVPQEGDLASLAQGLLSHLTGSASAGGGQ